MLQHWSALCVYALTSLMCSCSCLNWLSSSYTFSSKRLRPSTKLPGFTRIFSKHSATMLATTGWKWMSATRGTSYLQAIINRCKVSMFFVLTVFQRRSQFLAAMLQDQLYCPTPKGIITPCNPQQQMQGRLDLCIEFELPIEGWPYCNAKLKD